MFRDEEKDSLHAVIESTNGKTKSTSKAVFNVDGKEANAFEGSISHFEEKETENGKMYLMVAGSSEVDKPVKIWMPERYFIDLSLRLLQLSEISEGAEASTLVFNPYNMGESGAKGIVIKYEGRKIEKADTKKIKGLPEWEKKGKFFDSSKQADFLFKKMQKMNFSTLPF